MSDNLNEIIRIAARGDGVTRDGRHAALAAPGDLLGDDGTIVGRVITQRLTNPDLPAGFDNPPVDVLRDFVIQATPAN